MSTVQEIEEAISKLPKEEFGEIYAWMSKLMAHAQQSETRHIDEDTFEVAADEVFDHYAPLLKKLAE